ncbi:hypothetical protein NAG84_01710 [Proteus terrae]|uniref:hypothetical protein n=1 Tax=Proteus terrae TaxID=1574161 RepID=UPI0020954137|nr:hypothetical protein [Proteus terrae]MCO7048568.1 hypothetical protein [Proteus terrae]
MKGLDFKNQTDRGEHLMQGANWVNFEAEKPPVSHTELVIENKSGKKLVARYLSGDCFGGDFDFYDHYDNPIRGFKCVRWLALPEGE